jgi:hypothetical protein
VPVVELEDVGEELHAAEREADVLEATTTSAMKCLPVDRSLWALVWVSMSWEGKAEHED